MTRRVDRRSVGAENAAELVNTYEDMHRLPRRLHTLKLGPYEVRSTLTLAELTDYHPTEEARVEWARKVAGYPRKPTPQERAEQTRREIVRAGREWTERAQCADPYDEEAALVEWVPTGPTNSSTGETVRWAANRRRALKVCARCPVQRECLREGLEAGPPRLWGIWGGTTETNRDNMRAARARAERVSA